jgi:hypothetical protein
MFLRGDHVIGGPQQTQLEQVRIANLDDAFFKTCTDNTFIQYMLEGVFIKINGGFNEPGNKISMLAFGQGCLLYFLSYLLMGQGCDPGYFPATVVQERNTQQFLQVLIVIKPVFTFLSLGRKEIITVLPYPEGMRFYAGKIFYIPDSKTLHIGPIQKRSGVYFSKNFAYIGTRNLFKIIHLSAIKIVECRFHTS